MEATKQFFVQLLVFINSVYIKGKVQFATGNGIVTQLVSNIVACDESSGILWIHRLHPWEAHY